MAGAASVDAPPCTLVVINSYARGRFDRSSVVGEACERGISDRDERTVTRILALLPPIRRIG